MTFFTALAFGLTLPGGLQATSVLLGDFDSYGHIWQAWRIKTYGPFSPVCTNMLAFPYGTQHVTAFPAFLVNYVLALVMVMLPTPLAYNAVLIVGMALTGFTLFLICRRLSANTAVALLCSASYLLSRTYLVETQYGQLETACRFWFFGFVYFLVGMDERPARRTAFFMTLFYVFAGCNSWYDCLMGFMLLALKLMWPGQRRGIWVAPTLVALVFTLYRADLVTSSATPPGYVPAAQPSAARVDWKNPDSVVSPAQEAFNESYFQNRLRVGIVDARALFTRSATENAYNSRFMLDLIWLAALLGLRRNPYWGVVMGLSLTLSMGAFFTWDGRPLFALPLAALYRLFPAMVYLDFKASRFYYLASLAATLCAASGLGSVLRGERRPAVRSLTLALLTLAIVVDAFFLSTPIRRFTTMTGTVPDFFREVAHEPDPSAILGYPYWNTESGRHMYYQTVHGKPILTHDFKRFEGVSLLRTLWSQNTFLHALGEGATGADRVADVRVGDVNALHRLGYRYVVVDTQRDVSILEPNEFTSLPIYDLLEAALGPPREDPSGLLIYRFPAPDDSRDRVLSPRRTYLTLRDSHDPRGIFRLAPRTGATGAGSVLDLRVPRAGMTRISFWVGNPDPDAAADLTLEVREGGGTRGAYAMRIAARTWKRFTFDWTLAARPSGLAWLRFAAQSPPERVLLLSPVSLSD